MFTCESGQVSEYFWQFRRSEDGFISGIQRSLWSSQWLKSVCASKMTPKWAHIIKSLPLCLTCYFEVFALKCWVVVFGKYGAEHYTHTAPLLFSFLWVFFSLSDTDLLFTCRYYIQTLFILTLGEPAGKSTPWKMFSIHAWTFWMCNDSQIVEQQHFLL